MVIKNTSLIFATFLAATPAISADGYIKIPSGQHLVTIEFENPQLAEFGFEIEWQYTYNVYDKKTGEYEVGNDLPFDDYIYFNKAISSEIFFEGPIIFNPSYNNNVLKFWIKKPPLYDGDACSRYGRNYICHHGSYITNITPYSTGGQNISISYSHVGDVPEPATWALLIAGFGLVGGACRRQSQRHKNISLNR